MKPITAVPLEEAALTTKELARACSVQMTWVVERVQAGLLGAVTTTVGRTTTVVAATPSPTSAAALPDEADGLRFHSPELIRARRLATLERDFDADPALAALAVDLIEEVERLRRRLRAVGHLPG